MAKVRKNGWVFAITPRKIDGFRKEIRDFDVLKSNKSIIKVHLFENYELLLFSKNEVELIQQLTIQNYYNHLDREDIISIIFDKALVSGNSHAKQLLQIAVSDVKNFSKRTRMRSYAELVEKVWKYSCSD